MRNLFQNFFTMQLRYDLWRKGRLQYLSTNLYGSLWFGLCLQCSPTAPSRLQQMGPPMKALSHRIVLIPFFCTFGYLQLSIYLLTYMGVFDLAFVSTYRWNGRIKPDKWHLGRKRGYLWFYLMRFDHDPVLLGSCIERKSNGFLVAFCKTWLCSLAEELMCWKYFHSLMPRSPCWYTGGWLVLNM